MALGISVWFIVAQLSSTPRVAGAGRLTGSPVTTIPSSACPKGMPFQKCLAAITPLPKNSATSGTTLVPPSFANAPKMPSGWASPVMVQCGPGFFDSATVVSQGNQFGLLTCFRFSGSPQWVLIGDGMSLTSSSTPPAASRGGSIIAILTCVANDTACLDPNTIHQFSSFTAYFPPVPQNGRMELQGTIGTEIITVSVGYCGQFSFVLHTGAWYNSRQLTTGDITALINKSSIGLAAASTPLPETGSAALGSNAPTAIPGQCLAG